MAWIKRNLVFVIGTLVAVVLLALAGFYDFKGWRRNATALASLNEAYQALQRFNSQNPSPGNKQVDNIAAAREQERQLREWIKQSDQYFKPIPPIPDSPNGVVRADVFAGVLGGTVVKMQRAAAEASVLLPPDYHFSFAAEWNRVTFAPGSLEPLAAELGDIKAICGVLFAAKVNSLDNLQRVPVSADDAAGSPSDYLGESPVTNGLAVFMPYELTFRCFSQDLANVLAGFANSPHGFIVKAVNVQPASAAAAAAASQETGGNSVPSPYGARYAPGYGTPGQPAAPAGVGGLQTVLQEQLLSITLEVEAVKRLPQK
jgi:hypothetical protein